MNRDTDLVPDDQGATSRRSLNLIIMADTSTSMHGSKIQSLNQAMRNVLVELKDVAITHPEADLLLRVISFGSEVQWQTPEPQPVADFNWTDLTASGLTPMGEALELVTKALNNLPEYQFTPMIVLLSDGGPTDDWEKALEAFNQSSYGKKPNRTVRVAIAIGDDANDEVLADFTKNRETVLSARTPQQLGTLLRWATVAVPKAVSGSRPDDGEAANLPAIPPVEEETDSELW